MKMRLLFLLVITVSFCKAQSPVLWGMTIGGGFFNQGAVFSYNTQTAAINAPLSFRLLLDGTTNSAITTSFIRGSNGLLYGVQPLAGPDTIGVLFSFDISNGHDSTLFNFTQTTIGAVPAGPLLMIGDSIFYGTTEGGGAYNSGTIFSYNIYNGTYTDLHDFGLDTDGIAPAAALIQANNGILYGTTQAGGANAGITFNNQGTIYSYNISSGNYTLLFSFPDSAFDSGPNGPLIQAKDSLLYGLTSDFGQGTLYSYNISTGHQTVLHNFSDSDGSNPEGSLLQTENGTLYGLAFSGGLNSEGTLFSYNPANGLFLVQHNFGSSTIDGSIPNGSLMHASDGKLYGTTELGGLNNFGTIFSFDTAALTTAVLQSFDSVLGAFPQGALLEANFPTSVPQLSTTTQLQISPNPSTGQFAIQLPGNESNYQAQIYNTLGQKIEELTLTINQNTLNLSNQPTGMYFITLQTSTGPITGKVIVER